MQPLFQNGGGLALRLVLLVTLSIATMVADHRGHYVEQVRSVLYTAITPLQYAASVPAMVTEWGASLLTTQRQLRQRVEQLERRNLRLNARQQKFETLLAENDRLRQLLDASAKREERVLVGQLLAVDLDPFRQQVIVNQGSRSGIFRGQPVIDATGVMGQVIQTGAFTATVLLISDPDHALPVQINRTGLRTIAAGTGEADRISLLYIPNSADIQVDDLVITSGLGGRFPANYPVARISAVERRPGRAFAAVTARPLANLDRSREVLMVWPDERQRSQAREIEVDPEGMPSFDQPATDPGMTPDSTATTPPDDTSTIIPDGELDASPDGDTASDPESSP